MVPDKYFIFNMSSPLFDLLLLLFYPCSWPEMICSSPFPWSPSELVYLFGLYLRANLIIFKHCCLIPAAFACLAHAGTIFFSAKLNLRWLSVVLFCLLYFPNWLFVIHHFDILKVDISGVLPLLFSNAQIHLTAVNGPEGQTGMLCNVMSRYIHTCSENNMKNTIS